MSLRTNQSGFSVIELSIVAVVLVVLGFVAFSVYNRTNSKSVSSAPVASASQSNTAKASDVASAPQVKSPSDLDKASTTLDQTDPSGSNVADASDLDAELATF